MHENAKCVLLLLSNFNYSINNKHRQWMITKKAYISYNRRTSLLILNANDADAASSVSMKRARSEYSSNHQTTVMEKIRNIFIVFHLSVLIKEVFCGSAQLQGQLYEDLLYDYNKIPRPVKNSTDILTVDVGASLIRIIDVDEKNQILTTNLWLEMQWIDAKLTWNPAKYGGLKTLHIPSDLIWTPDFVLYNNAAGDPDITIFTDALVAYDGRVFWQPPAIYKSFCPIDVTWFPYDSQNCEMKFGAWTYTGYYVDLKQLPKDQVVNGTDKYGQDVETMEIGMDLSFFYRSAEWDLLSLSSARHSVLYTSCCGPEKYVDITYYFVLRRKTLFYTCNLIVPCFLISILTTFVFYLSDHKITFSISILVTLTVFFLVLIDIMPPTSLVIPMFGRYLITTMILVSLSTVVSVITVNFRFRSGSAHRMSPWIRSIFLNFLPKVLFMSRPRPKQKLDPTVNTLIDASSLVGIGLTSSGCAIRSSVIPNSLNRTAMRCSSEREHTEESMLMNNTSLNCRPSTSKCDFKRIKSCTEKQRCYHAQNFNKSFDFKRNPYRLNSHEPINSRPKESSSSSSSNFHTAASAAADRELKHSTSKQTTKDCFTSSSLTHNTILLNLLQQVRFIAEHFQHQEAEAEISDDWTFVAMVLDRLFLIIFSVLNVGTFLIILEAPSIYDTREPMNITVASKPLGQGNVLGTSQSHSRF